MTTTPAAPLVGLRACVFVVDDRPLAVDAGPVRGVEVFGEWTRVPLAPAPVIGVANLRGEVVPILDPRPALGRPPARPGRRQLALVVAAGAGRVALAVDAVLGLEQFESVQPLAPGTRAEAGPAAVGELLREGGRATLLDLAAVLAALRPGGPAAAGRPR